MNELLEILLGAVSEYCPEQYREITLAVSSSAYTAIILIGCFWLFGWGCKTIYKAISGGDDK